MLSILGGCATRDIFRISGADSLVRNLWARMTVPSIMARPIPSLLYREDYIPEGFESRQSFIDVNKLFFDHFSAAKPGTLLIDFMSEIYHLGSVGDALVTMAEHTSKRKSELDMDLPLIPPFSAERVNLMAHSLPIFLRRLGNDFGTRVIVHEVFQSEHMIDSDGNVTLFPADCIDSIRRANQHLQIIYDIIRSELPGISFFRGDKSVAFADVTHRWGLSPFHLSSKYSLSALESLRGHVDLPTY